MLGRALIAGLLILLGLAGVAAAATYTVDAAHIAASDSGPGTAAQPWKTIQHAASKVVAGDTVLVKAGTYKERVSLAGRPGGAAGKPITFQATPSRSVTMQGFDTGSCGYLRIEGFQITGSAGSGVSVESDNVEVIDNTIFDIHGSGIDGEAKNAHLARNRITKCQYGIVLAGTAWIVEDNEVERLYKWGSGDSDYCRFFGDDHIIRRNYFHGAVESEIGDAHVDGFQTFDDNGEHVKNILIEGNTVYNFHQAFMGESVFHDQSSGLTFRNNVFAHGLVGASGAAWGLCIKAIDKVTAVHNVFADIAYFGIGLGEKATGAVIKNNIFYNVEDNVANIDADSPPAAWDYNFYNKNKPASPGPHDLLAADPGFVAFAKDDFHLLGTGVAVDRGCDAGVTVDKDGNLRPQGKGFDLGPYEFTTTPVGDRGLPRERGTGDGAGAARLEAGGTGGEAGSAGDGRAASERAVGSRVVNDGCSCRVAGDPGEAAVGLAGALLLLGLACRPARRVRRQR